MLKTLKVLFTGFILFSLFSCNQNENDAISSFPDLKKPILNNEDWLSYSWQPICSINP